MESHPLFLSSAAPVQASVTMEARSGSDPGRFPLVDPFLAEAIENPRHRLTVLRIEVDIQKFMQTPDQQQFEFQPIPTSYLRCAAYRVAQHYGLQTLALDYTVDGSGSRIVARKTPRSKFPTICLSDIPTKQQAENDKLEQVKISIRQRPKPSAADALQLGVGKNPARSVEEREEEYDKARARIFSGSFSPEVESLLSMAAVDDKRNSSSSTDCEDYQRVVIEDNERFSTRDGVPRVAIFRDREKDLIDPDYDRSYNRYVRGSAPSHNFNYEACNSLHPSMLQYNGGVPYLDQMPRVHPLMSYRPSEPTMTSYPAVGCNQAPPDAAYMQWPTAMIYAHSYENLRRASFQAPVYPQPLSFECRPSR